MQTVTKAVNLPFGVPFVTAIAEGGSPTAWHLRPAYNAVTRMPPALLLQAVISKGSLGVNPERPFQR